MPQLCYGGAVILKLVMHSQPLLQGSCVPRTSLINGWAPILSPLTHTGELNNILPHVVHEHLKGTSHQTHVFQRIPDLCCFINSKPERLMHPPYTRHISTRHAKLKPLTTAHRQRNRYQIYSTYATLKHEEAHQAVDGNKIAVVNSIPPNS
jgi:hypothetical protein